MNYIREFFYLRKSDRKVILTLLSAIVIALVVIFMTGGSNESNELTPADTVLAKRDYRDSTRRQPYREQTRTVYVRTKVVYRDTSYRRGKALSEAAYDSVRAPYQKKIKAGEHIVLNTADTTALKTVPGIGSYYARKIIAYGQRLGGYVSVDQLDEIEGFRSMPRIISPSKTLRPVNSMSTPSRSMSSGNILTSISIRQRPLPNTVAYMAPSTL